MIWIKENGQEIEINDRKETIEYAKSLGWKVKKDETSVAVTKEMQDAPAKSSPKKKARK